MTAEPRTVLPLVSAMLCASFSYVLFLQWRRRRKSYQLAWVVGLLCYTAAAGADAWGQAVGWSEGVYRTWYLFGAIAAAAWLGLGEVYLMQAAGFGELVALGVFAGAIPAFIAGGRLLGAHQDAAARSAVAIGIAGIAAAAVIGLVAWERPHLSGHATLAILLLGTTVAAFKLLSAPVSTAEMLNAETHIPQGAALPDDVRLLTPLFNIGGALALAFGAAYSAWAVWKRGAQRERLISNSLIALGAFAPSLTSSLNRFGWTETFYWGELLGVLLIFAGFLASSEVFARRARVAASPNRG